MLRTLGKVGIEFVNGGQGARGVRAVIKRICLALPGQQECGLQGGRSRQVTQMLQGGQLRTATRFHSGGLLWPRGSRNQSIRNCIRGENRGR